MKVVVTGATGFLGPAIVSRLQSAGHIVVGAGRRAHGSARLDVTDPASCRALLDAHPGTDAVVHAAALAHVPAGASAAATCEAVNVEGTRNIVRAAIAAGVARFVFISSVAVYGDYDLPVSVTEEVPAVSTSLYGAAKRRGEDIVAAEGQSMARWILRMSTMYSPGWLFNVRKRVSPPVIGRFAYVTVDPNGRRYTLCSQRNAAEVVTAAIDGNIPPGAYNVSDHHVYSQGEILAAVERVEGPRFHLPIPVVVPRAASAVASIVPLRRFRESARSRYWKFCEHNVYSAQKLSSHGLTLPPDLLRIAGHTP